MLFYIIDLSSLVSFIVFKTLGTVNAARADNPAKTTTSSTRVKPCLFLLHLLYLDISI